MKDRTHGISMSEIKDTNVEQRQIVKCRRLQPESQIFIRPVIRFPEVIHRNQRVFAGTRWLCYIKEKP